MLILGQEQCVYTWLRRVRAGEVFPENDELDRQFQVEDLCRDDAWRLASHIRLEHVHFWGRNWQRLTSQGIYPSRRDILLQDSRSFVAGMPTTVPDLWLRHLQFLSDDRHKAIGKFQTYT